MKYLAIVLFSLVLGYSHVQGVPSIAVTSTARYINAGEDVEIHCIVTEFPDGDIVPWYKTQGQEAKVQMGTNTLMNSVFKNTLRYTARMQQDESNNVVTFVISIEGAVAEDSGEIGCSLPSQDVAEVFTEITVLVPPQTIHLYEVDSEGTELREYRNADHVEFNENDQYYFKCVSEGSNPKADIQLSLRDEDVSDKFQYESTYTVEGGQPGLKQVLFRAESTTKEAVIIDKDQNTLPFKCSASVQDSDPLTIELTPLISYQPVIECPQTHIRKPAYTTVNLRVVCYVKAEPHTEEIYLAWQNKNGENITLTKDDSDEGHYRMKVNPGNKDDEKEITFEIDRLYPQTFRTYTVHARNSLGKTTKNIVLERDYGQEDNAGNYMAMSMFSLAVMLLCSKLL